MHSYTVYALNRFICTVVARSEREAYDHFIQWMPFTFDSLADIEVGLPKRVYWPIKG